MKYRIRKMNWLFRHGLDAGKFYAITIYDYKVIMQCRYDAKFARLLTNKGWKMVIDSSGFVCFRKSDIEIAMT